MLEMFSCGTLINGQNYYIIVTRKVGLTFAAQYTDLALETGCDAKNAKLRRHICARRRLRGGCCHVLHTLYDLGVFSKENTRKMKYACVFFDIGKLEIKTS